MTHSSHRNLLEFVPDSVLILDRVGRITDANQLVGKTFGWKPSELVGSSIDLLLYLNDSGSTRRPVGDVLQRADLPLRLSNAVGMRATGNEFPCEVSIAALDDTSEPGRWIALIRDMESRTFRESQLRENLKMSAVASLARRIANDFNNSLAAVKGNIEAAQLQLGSGPPPVTELENASQATQRAARLVRRLLNFSSPASSELAPVRPDTLVRRSLNVIRRNLRENISVITSHNHADWMVLADREQIVDLLLNLIQNSIEAMPGGGTLTISTASSRVPHAMSTTRQNEDRDFVRIDVADTGAGIPPDVIPHIFEPFYTTKSGDDAVGLGLASVYGILAQHGGGITVESSVGQGTTFSVFLPRATPPAAPESTAVPSRDTGITRTVLLIDDEAAVRRPTRTALERSGFTVLEAADGMEGLELYEQELDNIDLVLLDIVMPRLSGWKVLERLKAARPNLPIVVVSGYPACTEDEKRPDVRPDAFLRKPYELTYLIDTLRRLSNPSSR